MAHPTVCETSAKDYEVRRSGAFIALFTQALDSRATASVVISQPHTPFLPGHTVRLIGQPPINLLHVPTDSGQTTGDYRITVAVARLADDRVDLTCSITNTAPGPRTGQWEIRGTRDDVISWGLAFGDKSDGTVVDLVASDPRAELSAPATASESEPVVLFVADPRGTPAEPTVIGILPADLQPRISWSHVGDVTVPGLPACTSTGRLTVVLPAAGQPTPLTLEVRTTFGGTCPLNTAYLESMSEPVAMTVTPQA